MCNHDDEHNDDAEFHLCKNSLDSLDGHEDFMNATEIDGRGNCCENYSTFERYLRNANELSENDARMSIEHRQHFQETPHQHQHHQQHQHQHIQENEFGSSRNFDENLDLDDDGLIGFEDAGRQNTLSSFDLHEHDENNIELISYENNFNLYNSFWWAMGTLIQSSSDLNPKVSLNSFRL